MSLKKFVNKFKILNRGEFVLSNSGNIKFINIGFGNIVLVNRLIVIVSLDLVFIKRIIQEVRERGMFIDVIYGRRIRVVIIIDVDYVIFFFV